MTEPERPILTSTTDMIPAGLRGSREVTKMEALCSYGSDAFDAMRDLGEVARDMGYDAVVSIRLVSAGDSDRYHSWVAYGTAISW